MYNPTNIESLMVDCTKVLLNLEKYSSNISFDNLFIIEDFVHSNPGIDMHEFIALDKCPKDNPYLLRYGIYNAILDIISINISNYFSGKIYASVGIISEHHDHIRGRLLKCDDLFVDIQTQNEDISGISIQSNWFAYRDSNRIQIVDIVNNLWVDIDKNYLFELYREHGNIVDINFVNGDTKMYPISKDIWSN